MPVATLVKSDPKAIEAWFDMAEKLTTGLGGREANWTNAEARKFHKVLDSIQSELQRTVSEPEVRVSLETVTMFLLGRLAMRNTGKAFTIAEQIRAKEADGSLKDQLALFQSQLASDNPKLLKVKHASWPDPDELERRLEGDRSVPSGKRAVLAHRRAEQMMLRFFPMPQTLKAA
jgi:hypothetical protein